MKIPFLLMLTLLAAAPAHAQHAGHTVPIGSPPAPAHDGHSGAMPAPTPDPHAGHHTAEPAPDPHAGHSMPEPAPDPHAGHRMTDPASEPPAPEDAVPPAALSGPDHAADSIFGPSRMREARETLREDQGALQSYKVMVDRLETRIRDGRDGYVWDAEGWYGSDIDKLWIKTEGEGTFGKKMEEAEVQALWSRAITPWFDFQAGLRYDIRPEPERGYGVLGIQGLAPYLFELDATAFVSNKGDVTARIEAEYELMVTQRLVLQPRAEINLAAQDVEPLGIGAGISDLELGARLRYEFAREFAPYIGVSWERKLFQTADFARDEGEEVDDLALVAGIRVWF